VQKKKPRQGGETKGEKALKAAHGADLVRKAWTGAGEQARNAALSSAVVKTALWGGGERKREEKGVSECRKFKKKKASMWGEKKQGAVLS